MQLPYYAPPWFRWTFGPFGWVLPRVALLPPWKRVFWRLWVCL